jgi:enamine deaminase RidA (YjgF/YER057c/UK114 family)
MAGENPLSLPLHQPTSGLAPPGGHYSHVAIANGFVFVSGQLPITVAGEKLVDASFEVQATRALSSLEHPLAAAGTSIDRLVQVRVYICDIAHWPIFNRIYAQWAGKRDRHGPLFPRARFTSDSR